MGKILENLRKGFSLLVIFVYLFVILFQSFPFINLIDEVKAESESEKVNLSLILVDGNVYEELKDAISWYAKDYIQAKNKNYKALVLPIDTKKITSIQIHKLIENLYFDGQKDKTSFLKGIILIGNIPLPIVNKNGYIFSSIYPYVDLVDPSFSYDKESGYFKYTGKRSDLELFHGLIKFDNINSYKKYFEKLKKYDNNPEDFVDKKLYYDNFITAAESFNSDMLRYYLNKLIFAENIITRKVTPLLLDYLANSYGENTKDIFNRLTEDSSSLLNNTKSFSITGLNNSASSLLGMSSENLKLFKETQKSYNSRINSYFSNIKKGVNKYLNTNSSTSDYWKIPTKSLETAIKNFTKSYSELFGNEYASNIDDNIKATGRYSWTGTVSTLNTFELKDKVVLSYLKGINEFLEKKLDEKIENEKYYLYYPVMTYMTYNKTSGLGTFDACPYYKNEVFFFGKNAKDLKTLSDIHIYRGTWGNFTGLDSISTISSRGKKSSVSILNNLFNLQTLSHRGFNTLKAKKDGDYYEKSCSNSNGACTDLGRYYNSEQVNPWAWRIFGGFSPINLKIDQNNSNIDPLKFRFNSENFKYAWHPSYSPNKDGTLFDIAGTNFNWNKQDILNTDTIAGIKNYASVWKTEYEEGNSWGGDDDVSCETKYSHGTNKVAGDYYDYFKDFSSICNNNCSVSSNVSGFVVHKTITIGVAKGEDDPETETYNYGYKYIDTRIKHTSPTDKEFSGFTLATQLRPVDSENYISFLGVGGGTVKLTYPDLFSVEVYKNGNLGLELKKPNEILSSIKDYLRKKVNDYNKELENQLNNKDTYYNSYKKAFDKISFSNAKPHEYDILPEDYFINLIGEKKLSQIAEMLYYINLGWKEKPGFSNLKDELDSLYSGFDISQKLEYITNNYLDSESDYKVGQTDVSKEELNFPGKAFNGYEAGIIVSENNDSNISFKENLFKNNNTFDISNLLVNDNGINPNDAKKECGKPLGEAVILWEWPSAFFCRLGETLKKPFKITSTSACSIGSTPKEFLSSLWLTEEQQEKYNNPNKSLEKKYKEDGKYEDYLKFKDKIDNSFVISPNLGTYAYDSISGYITLNNYNSDLNELFISSLSIWSAPLIGNCLYFNIGSDYLNSCEGFSLDTLDKWKLDFYFYNPKTGEGRYNSYKAGQRKINFKFCNTDNICYVKQVVFSKSAGNLKYVDIKPFSDVMIYGGENPLVIKGYDALPEEGRYPNQINYTPYNYKLYLEPSIGLIKTSLNSTGSENIDFNFSSSDELLLIKSNTENLGFDKFNLVLKLDPVWEEVFKDKNDILKEKKVQIKITSKKKLLDSEVIYNKNYKIPNKPDALFKLLPNGKKIIDKYKLLKINIKPKVFDKVLKTPVEVKSTKHFIVGTFQTFSLSGGNTYEDFVKKNNFLITGYNGVDVYLLPTFKVGNYKIKIHIPGIKEDYIISNGTKKFELKHLFIKLDRYKVNKNESIEGKIYGLDEFNNLYSDLSGLNIETSDGIKYELSGNNLKITPKKSGYVKVIKNNISYTSYISVNNTFLPIDKKISVMYLSLFGYDWGKYANKIMENSDKNLAITTFLHKESDIKKYQYILGENLKNIGDFTSILYFDNGKLNIDMGSFLLSYNELQKINIKEISSYKLINENGVYYKKEQTDDYIKENNLIDGVIYINNKPVINFSQLTQSDKVKIIYSKKETKKTGFASYEVLYYGRKVGVLYFKGKIIDVNKLSIDKPIFTNIIPIGSSNGLKGFGISISSPDYKPLISYNIKKIGFRGKFKNISYFSSGMPVGLAGKDFANELIINYGDPFVKRINKNDLISSIYPSSKLNLSKSYGYKIYSSIGGNIKKVISLDFNNDKRKDILVLYGDSKIRLLKNYKGSFEDLGNLIILPKQVKDIFAGDVDGDGYEDIFTTFGDGEIRVYKNNHGEFDVNGKPACLNLAGSDSQKLRYDQIFFYDMNNDKKTDIVVNDLASNIKVFYGPSYLSTNSIFCDSSFSNRLEEQLVKSYSMKVDSSTGFVDDGYIYWEGIEDKSKTFQKQIQEAFKSKDLDSAPIVSGVDLNNYYDKVLSKTNSRFAFQDIPGIIGPSWDNENKKYYSFKKVVYLTGSDPIKVYKKMEDLNGGVLMPGDKIKITLHIDNPHNKKLTYLEALKGPFSVISIDNKPILTGLNGLSTGNISYPLDYPNFLFKLDNISGSISLDYYAYFNGKSSVKIKVGNWDDNSYGEIKVYSKNGCIKGYDYFQGQDGNIPMTFLTSYIDISSKLKNKAINNEQNNKISSMIEDIKNNVQDIGKMEKYLKSSSSSIWDGENASLSADLNIDVKDLNSIKSSVNKLLNGLCNGFSFGKSSCGGLQIPCNMAFLTPGIANLCGCPLGIKKGISIFNFPGTRWINCSNGPFPIPLPNHGSIAGNAYEGIAPTGCGPAVFPSTIRIYATPTLTAGAGFAICIGPYAAGMTSPPPPFGTIAGGCIVIAGDLSSSCSKKNKNGDDVLEEWMNDLDNGLCSSVNGNNGLYPTSAIVSNGYNNFWNSDISSLGGGVSIAGKQFISFNSSAHKINSLEDAEQLLEGGTPINLNVKMGSLKGIFSCIIKKWLNKQIQFIISQLTSMTIYITYPQFKGSLMNGLDELSFEQFTNGLDDVLNKFGDIDFGIGDEQDGNSIQSENGQNIYKKLSKYLPSGEGLRSLNESLENPFSKVQAFFDNVPLINVRLKTVVIKVPWIGKDEIERQITYLENWLQRNKNKIDKRKESPENLVSVDVNKFVNSVQKNIEILNKYRNFPLQLYKYLHLIDTYLSQISCILNKYFDMIIGWIVRQSKIFEKWVDAIIALINIFRTWQLLIDISVNWKSSCGKCRMDTGDLYDCTLSLLCPSLPVLPIPPFKIPDIFIDFSHINLGIDIILPKIKIYPVPIGVFTLPDLPDIGVKFSLPKLPLLPEPPTLPDLPALPAIPVLELPNLPPPPKIPELLPSIQAALNIFKIIGYFRCLIKNGIAPLGEWNISSRIEQLTARHNRIFPFDFINIDFPVLPFKGNDVRIDAYVNFRLELSQIYDYIKGIADSINKETKNAIGDMLESNAKWNLDVDKVNGEIQEMNLKYQGNSGIKEVNNDLFQAFIINKKPLTTKVAKIFLKNELEYFISQNGKNYLNSLDRKYFATAKDILDSISNPVIVKSNEKSIKNIKKKVFSIIDEQSIRVDRIRKIIKDMENGKKIDFNNDLFITPKNKKLISENYGKDVVYKFSTSLFSTSEDLLNIIKNSKAPKQYYLEMYSKVLNKLNKKLEQAKQSKKGKFIYEEYQQPVKKSLEIINSLSGNLSYAPGNNDIEKPILPDPTQAIKGLYMKGDDGDYYNVLGDKKISKKIRRSKRYFEYDFNKDEKNDLLWYDSYNIYIKYSNDEVSEEGIIYNKAYIYNDVISNFRNIADDDGYIDLNGEKFKIWSSKFSVNTLKLDGQSFENIKLKWKKSDDVNAYYILYSSRLDILSDIEKIYSYSSDFTYELNNYKTYAIVLYDKNLGNINEVLANEIKINGHKATSIVYIPIDLSESLTFVLDKNKLFLKDKWKYFRIYNAKLNLEIKQLNILSSYSNQEVGGEQIIADDTSPFVTPILLRTKGNELNYVVGTGINLVGYINTEYKLKANWSDNIGLKFTAILDKDKNIISSGNEILLSSQFHPNKLTYYLYGLDYNNNEKLQKVTIDIRIPKIDLVKVNGELGFAQANISNDMDNTAVRFGIETENGVKFLESVNGNSLFTGTVFDREFTGSIFKLKNTLSIYSEAGEKIGEINLENSIIKLTNNTDYLLVGKSEGNLLNYIIYNKNTGKSIFKIRIPSEEIVSGPVVHNISNYELKEVNYNGYKYCILSRGDNKCMIFISEKGNFFIDSIYEDNILVKYTPDGDNVKLEFYYDDLISDGINGEKIFELTIKEKSLLIK